MKLIGETRERSLLASDRKVGNGTGEMSRKPLVSVIISFLNGEKFIQEAIESVFAQTYDNWELLLVDDGSTDAGTQVALRYAEQYPEKVRYLEHNGHRNRGSSASRNLGSNNAKGKYIAFLDVDDVWLPHKLAQQVAILESRPEAVMVYGPARNWYEWSGKPKDVKRDFVQSLCVPLDSLVKPPALVMLFLRNERAVPPPSSILVRRDVVRRVGGFEETFRGTYGIYEDQVFYVKLGLKAPVFVSGECLLKYRIHRDSMCAVAARTGQYHSARRNFLNWVEEYFSSQEVKGEASLVLQKELLPYRHPFLHGLLKFVRNPIDHMKRPVMLAVRRTLPSPVRHWLRVQWGQYKRLAG